MQGWGPGSGSEGFAGTAEAGIPTRTSPATTADKSVFIADQPPVVERFPLFMGVRSAVASVAPVARAKDGRVSSTVGGRPESPLTRA